MVECMPGIRLLCVKCKISILTATVSLRTAKLSVSELYEAVDCIEYDASRTRGSASSFLGSIVSSGHVVASGLVFGLDTAQGTLNVK
jgi:hypothetical protein